jgi:hypothetical protein
MRLPGEKDAFGCRCQIGAVLLSEFRDGEGVPAEGVGIADTGFELSANRGDPN